MEVYLCIHRMYVFSSRVALGPMKPVSVEAMETRHGAWYRFHSMIWDVADLESLILPNPVPLANIFCARLGKSASLGSLPQAGKARPAAPLKMV